MDLTTKISNYLILHYLNMFPESFRPAILTSTATLFGAFLGAFVAQYISHLLAKKRDKRNYFREIFQNLYSPLLLDVYSYLDIATHFRRGHDIKLEVNDEDILNNIIKYIGDNLKYVTPKLLTYYHTVKIYEYQDDFSGFMNEFHRIKLCEVFLDEFRMVSKKSGLNSRRNNKEIIRQITFYRIWSMLTYRYNDIYPGSTLLAYKFYFDNNKFTLLNLYRLKYFNIKFKLSNYVYYYLAEKEGFSKQYLQWFNQKLLNLLSTNEDVRKIMFLFITKRKYREHILDMINALDKPRESYNPNSYLNPLVSNIFFLDIKSEVSSDFVELRISIINHSEFIADIYMENFVLLKHNSMSIKQLEEKSGIWDGNSYSYKQYKLLPTESNEIQIVFSLKNVIDLGRYNLFYIYKNKPYPIYELQRSVPTI
ncbi:hypothetical protein JCM14036_12670 [Desulfotomaculum defluvii]